MILESGTQWTVAPFAATQITLDNPTAHAVSVRVGDAAPVEIKPREHLRVGRDLAAETLVECFGPGAAELSWLVAPDAAEQHPEYARLRARSVLDDPWRKAITEGWKKAFEPAAPPAVHLPTQLRRFDPTVLPNRADIDAGRGFNPLCYGWESGTSWFDGNARIDLTNMNLRNLSTAAWNGDPSFSDNDRRVTFTFRVDTLRLDGNCTMKQRCCNGIFGWCWYTSDYSAASPFQMDMASTVVRFQAMAVDDPAGLRVNVVDTAVNIQGATTVRFPGSDLIPEWMRYVGGDWAKIQLFREATQLASQVALREPVIRSVIQDVVNGWIKGRAIQPVPAGEF